MTKIIWSCHNCGTVLPLWKMKCPHKLALSWLHMVVVVVVALPALLLMLRFL